MKEQIIEWCKELAKSQGLYGRLLKEFEESPEFLDELAKHQFEDIIDFMIFIEC